jgi:hypothetical protein
LLRPDAVVTNEDPCGAGIVVVRASSSDQGVAVRGYGDEDSLLHALTLRCRGIAGDQFGSLLGPRAIRAREYPGGSDIVVVTEATHDERVAIGGEGDLITLKRGAGRVVDGELVALLNERLCEDPT